MCVGLGERLKAAHATVKRKKPAVFTHTRPVSCPLRGVVSRRGCWPALCNCFPFTGVTVFHFSGASDYISGKVSPRRRRRRRRCRFPTQR